MAPAVAAQCATASTISRGRGSAPGSTSRLQSRQWIGLLPSATINLTGFPSSQLHISSGGVSGAGRSRA